MKEINIKKVLSSFEKMSKQWGLGKSVGKVWGFLLFNSKPMTQEEIEKGIRYSRGLISRSLKKLRELNMINITKKGKEIYYSANTSLIDGFNNMINDFLETEIKPLIDYLSKNLNKIEDGTIRENVRRIIREYEKLNIGILIFSKTMKYLSSLNMENNMSISKK